MVRNTTTITATKMETTTVTNTTKMVMTIAMTKMAMTTIGTLKHAMMRIHTKPTKSTPLRKIVKLQATCGWKQSMTWMPMK